MESGLALGHPAPVPCRPPRASAVSNAGGIGTIGAIGMSPEGCRAEVQRLKKMLVPGDSIAGTVPFGLDLLLPQVGGNARKTNKDYTGGQLEERA